MTEAYLQCFDADDWVTYPWFYLQFCCATLSLDKIAVCNCTCWNCNKSHKQTQALHHNCILWPIFTNWVHKLWNFSDIFLFLSS